MALGLYLIERDNAGGFSEHIVPMSANTVLAVDSSSSPKLVAQAELWELRLFGFNTAHNGWYPCTGGIMPDACWANLVTAGLSSAWASAYGTKAIPDFTGRVLAQVGTGHDIGSAVGTESITLSENQLPVHAHGLTNGTANAAVAVSSAKGNQPDPNGNYLAKCWNTRNNIANNAYVDATKAGTLTTLAGVGVSGSTDSTGSSETVPVMQPTSYAGYWHVYLGT